MPSSVPAHVLVAINRCVASKAKQEVRERCLLEGVEGLYKTVTKEASSRIDVSVRQTSWYLKNNKLCLLQADKEGGFVVVERGAFDEKVLQAVSKSFLLRKVRSEKNRGSWNFVTSWHSCRSRKVFGRVKAIVYLYFSQQRRISLICHSEPLSASLVVGNIT